MSSNCSDVCEAIHSRLMGLGFTSAGDDENHDDMLEALDKVILVRKGKDTKLTKDELVSLIKAAIPYPDQITDWDVSREEDAVRFTWRGDRFRVTLRGVGVDQCDPPGFLKGSNLATLLGRLLKLEWEKSEKEEGKA